MTTLMIQTQNCAGRWSPAASIESLSWLGRAVVLTADQMASLVAGRDVMYASEWYSLVRLAGVPVALRPISAMRYTCRSCGEHRDTTMRDHCDDCEA